MHSNCKLMTYAALIYVYVFIIKNKNYSLDSMRKFEKSRHMIDHIAIYVKTMLCTLGGLYQINVIIMCFRDILQNEESSLRIRGRNG